jgi:pyruvate ferredoxin oxidoreductase gamma subunit
MFSIRIHGRGGQGAKIAAEILARAALLEGKFIQAFPEYGPERSGAPVVSYVRISSQLIKTHQPVVSPQAVLVLDPTLLDVVDVAQGLNKKGILIINSATNHQLPATSYQINASSIALKYIKKDKPNTVLLGVLAKVSGIVKLESLIEIIREIFSPKIGKEEVEANVKAVQSGYKAF